MEDLKGSVMYLILFGCSQQMVNSQADVGGSQYVLVEWIYLRQGWNYILSNISIVG